MASRAERSATVQSLARGLSMLELVNSAGGIRPGDAARKLSLPRPTSYRILETLEEMGYVCRTPSDNRFVVTGKAARLGGSYNGEARLSRVAGPPLARLLKEIVWPVNVTTYWSGAMVVRETTHGRSPLAFDRDLLGLTVPMLRSASGRAYLAFCDPAEQAAILDQVRAHDDPEDEPFWIAGVIDRLLGACRAQGFATRLGERYVPRTSSIAVPILLDEVIQGALSVVWSTSAMTANEAIATFVPPLREAASEMSRIERY